MSKLNIKQIKDRNRTSHYKTRYGISREFVLEIFNEIQNGCCAICKLPIDETTHNFQVDHCHKINKVRGILCSGCNKGLGQFKENTQALENAIKYLKNNIYFTGVTQ